MSEITNKMPAVNEDAKRHGLIQAIERVQPQAERLAGTKIDEVRGMAADLKPIIAHEGQQGALKYLQSVR